MLTGVDRTWDTLVTLMPRGGLSRFLALAGQSCSADERAESERVFGPRAKSILGGPRRFALAREKLDLCVAREDARGPGAGEILPRTPAVTRRDRRLRACSPQSARRGEHLGHDGVDVGLGGPVVDQARPEREATAHRGVGEVDPPPAHHPEQQLLVQPVQLGVGAPAVAAVTEADGAERDRGEPLQLRAGVDRRGEPPGQREVGPDGVPVRTHPVVAQREPRLECAEAPRQLERLLEEGEPLHRVLEQRPGVVAGVRERRLRCPGVSIEQAATVERLVQPLVRVEGDGVGEPHPLEGLGDGERRERAVRPIDVHPQPVPPRHLGDGAERVDRPGAHRPGAGHDGDRSPACESTIRFAPHAPVPRRPSGTPRPPAPACTAACPRPSSAAARGIDMCTSEEA